MLQPLIDITRLVYCGMEQDDKTEKQRGEGLTVNAHRIIKTCEWRWIITSQAHLDMHIGGKCAGGKKNTLGSYRRTQLLRFSGVFWSLQAPWQ